MCICHVTITYLKSHIHAYTFDEIHERQVQVSWLRNSQAWHKLKSHVLGRRARKYRSQVIDPKQPKHGLTQELNEWSWNAINYIINSSRSIPIGYSVPCIVYVDVCVQVMSKHWRRQQVCINMSGWPGKYAWHTSAVSWRLWMTNTNRRHVIYHMVITHR